MFRNITITIFIFVSGVLFYLLKGGPAEPEKPYLLSYELGWRGDTFNKVDLNGLKQGRWFIYHYGNPDSQTDGRHIDSIGYFKDGKKVGYWTGTRSNDSMLFVNCRVELEEGKTYTYTEERDILFADTTK